MGVVAAKIQTVEDIYQVLWTAISTKRPVAATYNSECRLLCPHRLGRNGKGKLRVLCYQAGGGSTSGLEPAGSLDNWRCMDVERLTRVEIVDGVWKSAPNHSRPQTCVYDVDIDAET